MTAPSDSAPPDINRNGLMTALSFDRYGPPEVVQVTRVPIPDHGPGEVLVRVRASAVNTGDWRIRAAAFPGILALAGRLIYGLTAPRNPLLGSEFAGEVQSVGAQVTRFKPGDRVYGLVATGGASAQFLAVPETDAIAAIPTTLDYEEAAALPFGGLCALSFLSDFAHLSQGQRLLVVGASGGVGCYAVQIGKALGSHVTGVAGPDSQGFVAGLGADATIDYRASPLSQWPQDFDVILDTIGTLTPKDAWQLLRKNGLFLPLNFGLREIGAALLNPFLNKKTRLAVNKDTPEGLAQLSNLVQSGQLRPVIDSRFPLAQAELAHAKVETRHRHGSIVLIVD